MHEYGSKGTTERSSLHFNKARTVALLLLSLVAACTVVTLAENSEVSSAYYGGDCGGCKWSYDVDTETLTITKSPTGDGKMQDYYSWDLHPWFNVKVSHILVKEGVVHIGNTAFQDKGDLVDVTLPSTLTSIGRYAFSGSPNIQSIAFPSALAEMDPTAFNSTTFYDVTGGTILEQTAANFAGKAFSMVDGKLCVSPEPGPGPFPAPVSDESVSMTVLLGAAFVAMIFIAGTCAVCLRKH